MQLLLREHDVTPKFALALLQVFICLFFVLTKGAKKMIADNDPSWNNVKAAWISAASAGGALVLSAATMVPWVVSWCCPNPLSLSCAHATAARGSGIPVMNRQ